MKTVPDTPEFKRFSEAMANILKVSKTELQRRMEQQKSGRRTTPPASRAAAASSKKAR